MERLRHINYGKIFLVIFITVLIWVWADQAQDQEYTFENVILKAERSLASDLWLTIDGQRSIVLEELTLRGTASRLDELRRELKTGSPRMEFFISPAEVGFREPGEAAVNVLEFLRNSGRLRELRVSAVDAKPKTITVKVSSLVEKEVPVRVVRSNGNVLNPKKVEPATVKVRVPQDWGPAVADVVLNESEIEQARLNDFEKNAVIRLNQDETYPVATKVKVMMPPQTEDLSPFSITQATIGFVLSPNLVGKYRVVLDNYSELATFTISATPDASRAYREQPFQITLYILDEDAKNTGEQRKEVEYNFPEEFLRQNKIKLNQPAGIARFELEPLQSPAAAPGS
ncbi:MAG: hypothetical protein WC374_07825 [Phycisphaerae bacterium]|jgi:hypothetical protein